VPTEPGEEQQSMTDRTTSEEAGETRAMGLLATLTGVAVALVLSAAALIIVVSNGSGGGAAPLAAGADLAPVAAAAVDAPTAVSFDLDDLDVRPGDHAVAAGGSVEVVNLGAIPHDLVVEGRDVGTPMLDSGESHTFETADLDPGTYTVICTVPGHREAGMEGTLTVVGAGGEGAALAADDADDAHGEVVETASAGETLTYDPNAAPPDGFEARDPRLAPAPDQDVHEITIRAAQVEGQVAPGATQELWTFDEMVPGPVLRGKVGDLFRITFVNDGTMGHSIDFHASKVDPADEMRTIQPGESLVYEFEAKHAGAWMYHCGTAPVLHHTGNGQYGVLIVDPPDLPEVDHEYVFVQSEFYLGAEGEPGDLTKMMDEDWDIVAFNGYANQYAHDPIDDVEADERVRVWLMNAGPSENSAFHVIGTIFDTVYKEGAYRLRPGDEQGGAQALDLQPSQGGFVEFTFDEDGYYPFVTHKFANVGKGALGVFLVGDADAGAGH
jgi:nitrite reductase (NO-forming)